jgi:hypothetical protein
VTGINETEIINDTKKIFGENAELWINETKILNAQNSRNSIATEGIILDSALRENKVKVIMHYN